MKKAIYTLFQPQSLKVALMVVFAWCLSLQNVDAQIVLKYTAKDTTCVSEKLKSCNGDVTTKSTRFTDDGKVDGNYADSHARVDTVEICPKDNWHRVKVVFTDFDLADGDTLFAFNTDKKTIRSYAANGGSLQTGANAPFGAGSGSGTGVAKAFGGWIDGDCDPKINPTGCLTFIFQTNGDNNKGSGFDAWVDCEEKKIEFGSTNVASVKLTCDSAYTNLTINAPSVKACGTTLPTASDTVRTIVKNQRGETCVDTCLTNAGMISSYTGKFAIGIYTVQHILKSDKEKKTKEQVFSVQAPPLVCNDEIEVPLGAACMVRLVPDDLLEQPCDTITDTMYYNITITIGSGKNKKVLTTTGHNTGAPVVYPIITKADVAATGKSVCEVEASVEIQRVYYGRSGTASLTGVCNNGPQNASCKSVLKFTDLSKPVINITAGVDTIVACDTTGLGGILSATATDNCDDKIDVTFTVAMDEEDPCFNAKGKKDTTTATITFSATDDCGNNSTKTKVVTIIRPNENHLVKTKNVTVECKDEASVPVPGMAIGRYQNSKFTPTDTITLSTTKYICGYILYAVDEEIPSTDCGKKLYRYYDLIDWCAKEGGNVRVDTTFVEYTDKTAPVFQGESAAKVTPAKDIELGAFDCTYDITKFEGPKATDNCDANPKVSIDSIFRIEDGTKWGVPTSEWKALNCDSFSIRWVAEDNCHEQPKEDTTYQIVVIKDVTHPSAVCTDELIVSVPGDEGARIEIGEIDAGSSDACGIDKRELRRKGSNDAWADHVIITCEDVHNNVQIEMRVTDKKGNSNICWLNVTAEDKIPPVCKPLEDKSLTCKDVHTGELGASTDADGDGQMEDSEWQPLTGDLMNLYNSKFGSPDCTDNLSCGTLTIEQEYQLIEGECGALTAKRRYRANDWKPNSSTWAEQVITVTYVPDWKLSFPADVELTCNDTEIPAAWTPEQVITNGSCDLWSLSVSEKTFEVPGEICMKIERTYHLINDCVGSPTDPVTRIANNPAGTMITEEGNETVGRIAYTQVIKLYITEAPTVTINDVETCIVGVNDALPYGEEDLTPGAAPYECDTIRTFSASATNCIGADLKSNFTWKFHVNGTQVDAGSGSSFDKVVAPGNTYTVEFWASDGCGNSAGTTKDFVFRDCKKPTPYLLNGIAIELGQTGTVDVWATDLNRGSFDNCTDQSKLEMYIGIGEPNVGPTTIEEVRALGKLVTLGCDNVGTQSVSIYVVDEAGNWDVAGTYVLVQDNMDACTGNEGMGTIAGRVVNPNGENVEQVSVTVSGAAQKAVTTGTDGQFQFDLSTGANYTITPQKDMNPLNGVSTFDLVLISKHILGLNKFDSPYKYLAADVNKSGTITTFDMVQLRQLILNIIPTFPTNDSWRFVDSKHNFATENPASEEFNEFMSISNLNTNMNNIDFVGVKVGDINGNAASNSLLGAESRTTNGALTFNVADRFVEAGQTVTVDFASADMASTEGYQFTLKFAGLELAQLNEGVAKAANFNTNMANRGLIATSWNGEATADEVLFSITFNATTSGMLSELVSVNSELTAAEAYNTAGELLDVNIDFTAAVSANFELGQNTPNPFNGETVIGFNLPKAGTASLKVMDVQGKVLKHIEGEFAKGYNTVRIKANELGATGVLHYQLESADNVATKKMIIIE